MDKNNTIAIIGLGKLGSPMLACFASKGYDVIGVDINPSFVDLINKKESPVEEAHVTDLLKEYSEKIYATTDLTYAVLNSFICFIIVPSPSLEDGSFSTSYVERAVRWIAKVIKDIPEFYVINIVSTILPGSTQKMQEIVEEISGKTCGEDFGLAFNPDFIALGTVVHNFLNPDVIIIGESDPKTGQMIQRIHKTVIDNNAPIYRMSYHNAELTKISINSFLTMKVNFANSIAEICENMPKGDANAVLRALGADSRIGSKYLKSGLAVSGPCLVRDSKAFCSVATKFNTRAYLAEAVDASNNWQRERVVKKILQLIEKGEKVSILGLSYKPFTPVIEESISVYLAKVLIKKGISTKVFDPAAIENTKKELGNNSYIEYCNSIEDCLKDTSLCFVATAWPEFQNITSKTFRDNMRVPVIIDAWHLYSFDIFQEISLIHLGQGK